MKPLDAKLYAKVKSEADALFLAPTSAYKSAWIVREYKKRGGLYDSPPPPPSDGLKRWFREKWVDLNRKNAPCGRTSSERAPSQPYPLCRPTVRVSKETPVTVKELTPKQIRAAKKTKRTVEEKGRIKF